MAFVLLLLVITQIYGYSIDRLDNQPQNINSELNFFSVETDKFLDDEKNELDEKNLASTKPPGTKSASMFVLFVPNENYTGGGNQSTPLDSWSVVWYVASFGGLIVFFLIVSCSEWCCRRALRNQQNLARNTPTLPPAIPDTPPPSYEQFAPPSYESICLGRPQVGEKSEYDIFVVPVHTFGSLVKSEDAPPSYLSASTRC